MSDKDIQTGERRLNRRSILKLSGALGTSLSGVGVAAGRDRSRSNNGKRDKKIKSLIQELKTADDKEEYYKSLSEKEKELLKEGLRPVKIGSVWTSNKQVVSIQGMETTYTEIQHVTADNIYDDEIIQYNHELKWTVDKENDEITGMNVSTGGEGTFFWQYTKDIDPEQRTIDDDGCHSKKSGLFQYCNEVKGVGFCTAELNTRLTSDISGFPNGRSSTRNDKDIECGRSCY
ncbi:hypothetical protein [Halomicrobium sp. LC1Hm]|uniref:hypothetical protein n=1 Tax=Halomicrobium sp. LC1Hm TaxID=2610902 RepID=UPI0012983B76|nr:hypothetical protein [Halomicrobium sp. LC1Hm]